VTWERLEQGGAAFKVLRRQLAEALARVVEGTVLPAAERVHAGWLLGRLGDLRDGVCSLPPVMVRFEEDTMEIGEGEEQSNVKLMAFEIARYPVTNAQYAIFIDDNGYNPSGDWWDNPGKSWLRQEGCTAPTYWNDDRFGNVRPNHPVVGVTWYEATAFCRWLTRHLNDGYEYCLPTEAEWEYAARGAQHQLYPWGLEHPDSERANFNQIYQGTTPVGCFVSGATPKALLDMAGNVWDWTHSIFRPFPYNPRDRREAANSPAEKRFVLRGGGWYNQLARLRTSYRDRLEPNANYNYIGFRLARHRRK
jgi:formylglycine-generating enzyme required for sulfatase activity